MRIKRSLPTLTPRYWMVSVLAILGILLLVTLRSPTDVGPQGILLFFFLVLVALTAGLTELIKRLHERHNYRGRKLYVQRALTVSLPLTILFALQSQGSLNIFFAIVVVIAAVLFSVVVRSNINSPDG